MKRKLAIGLSVLLATCMLGACGTDPTQVEYKGKNFETMKMENFENLGIVQAIYGYTMQGVSAEEIVEANSELGLGAAHVAGTNAWAAAVEECGEFVAVQEESFTTTKSGKTVTSDVTVEFANRTAVFECVYTYYNMELSSISVMPDYTLGEKMSKAGLNTLISMAIVFMVLILIALIIYAFNIFPYLEKKKKEKAAAAAPVKSAAPAAAAPVVAAAPEENLMDDTELIAVIAAAIAASEGTSTSGFVVRSINRR